MSFRVLRPVVSSLALAALAALGFAGCAAPPADDAAGSATSEAAYTSASWQPLTTCDGGAAVLDVNTNERRNLQLVIHDKNILDYFYKAGAISLSYGAQEAIMGGYVQDGVWNQGDFRAATFQLGGANVAYVWREGDGIKVKIEYAQAWTEGCPEEYYSGSVGCTKTDLRSGVDRRELANWTFRSCK